MGDDHLIYRLTMNVVSDVQVESVDITGRVLAKHTETGLGIGVHVRPFPAEGFDLDDGLYFLRARSRGGEARCKVLIASG